MINCNCSFENIGQGGFIGWKISRYIKVVFYIFVPALTVFEILTFEIVALEKVDQGHGIPVRDIWARPFGCSINYGARNFGASYSALRMHVLCMLCICVKLADTSDTACLEAARTTMGRHDHSIPRG